ncbi:hypothetical protein C8J57DRAFT_1224250 [Mycena rebaudengoi]|nr:hypothetical protein C8J57DRAFT_1224250 [Mycena rebaudengoi]
MLQDSQAGATATKVKQSVMTGTICPEGYMTVALGPKNLFPPFHVPYKKAPPSSRLTTGFFSHSQGQFRPFLQALQGHDFLALVPGPKSGQNFGFESALTWPVILPGQSQIWHHCLPKSSGFWLCSQSQSKPGQSHGFQAKSEHHYQ